MTEQLKIAVIVSTCLACFIFAFFSLQVSQDDIDACMESTNYSQQRCIFELTR